MQAGVGVFWEAALGCRTVLGRMSECRRAMLSVLLLYFFIWYCCHWLQWVRVRTSGAWLSIEQMVVGRRVSTPGTKPPHFSGWETACSTGLKKALSQNCWIPIIPVLLTPKSCTQPEVLIHHKDEMRLDTAQYSLGNANCWDRNSISFEKGTASTPQFSCILDCRRKAKLQESCRLTAGVWDKQSRDYSRDIPAKFQKCKE